MKALFADLTSPDSKPVLTRLRRVPVAGGAPAGRGKPAWWEVFLEQLLNSVIVGGIAGLSTLASGEASWKVALIAFGLTALIELRKYRGLVQKSGG